MKASPGSEPVRPNHHTSSALAPKALPVGTVLAGRFRILGELGAGGQAQVYHARDEILGSDIAIKLIAPRNALDIEQVQRMRQEVLLARELNHPNIVRVFEFYQDGDWVFFTMALVSGDSLAALLHEGVARNQSERWMKQLLQALAACHAADITHADVKPENIYIDERGNLVLLDFGIGSNGEANPLADFSGSVGYIAPEVTQLGKRGAHTDCYSSGRLFLELLAATKIRRWHPGDIKWLISRKRLAKQLSKPLVHQRISILKAQQSIERTADSRVAVLGSLLLVLIIVAGTTTLFTPSYDGEPIAAMPNHTSRVAVVYAPDDNLLGGIAELLHLHLITQSGIDIVEQDRVDSLVSNLGLKPFSQQEHRIRIAQLVNAEVLILLQSGQLPVSDDIRIQVLFSEMPGNRMFGSFQGTVNNTQLPHTMEKLLVHIDEQLALPPRQLIVKPEELQRVEPILQALRQGRHAEAEQFVQSLQAEWPDFAGGWLAGARLAAARGDIQLAHDQLERLIELSENDEYWYLEGRALQAEINNDLDGAIAVTDRLLELFPGRASLLDRRAELAVWADDTETAMRLYQQALEIDPSAPDRWFELARMRIIQGQIQQALDNELMQALVKYRQQENMRGQGTVLNAFGVAYLRLSDASTAAQYFTEALNIRTRERDANGRAVTLANLANARALQLRYADAEAALAEASLLFEENNDRIGLAQVENEWGVLLEVQGRYREALTHYRNALDLRMITGYSRQQAESINNVAYMHFLMADFSQADVFWKQAKNLFARIGDQSGLARTELNLATLALTRGEYSQATQILTEVLESSQGRRPEEEMVTQFLLSNRNYSRGSWATALRNNEEALRIAESIEHSRGLVEVRIWGAEMCLYLANSQCIAEQLAGLEKYAAQLNSEQEILRDWIEVSAALLADDISTSEITAFWSRFRKQLLPVQSELRVLLSILELNPTPRDSWQWQRVRELVRPAMYKEYLHASYLQAVQFNDQEAFEQLRRTLQNHPDYWRNHLYYEIFSDNDSKRRAEQLRERLYQYMNRQQLEVYQQTYERPETNVRRGTAVPATEPR